MIMLGIVGEYLWRNLEEARGRPLYIIEKEIGFGNSNSVKNKDEK